MTALEFADDEDLGTSPIAPEAPRRPAQSRLPAVSMGDQAEQASVISTPGVTEFLGKEPVAPRAPAAPAAPDASVRAFAEPPQRQGATPAPVDTGVDLSPDPQIGRSVLEFAEGAKAQARHPVARLENEGSQFTKGFLAGVDQTQGLLYGAAGLAGSALGIEGVRDWGVAGYERNMAEAAENAPEVESITKVGNLGELGSWAAYTMGTLVPTMGTLFLGGGLGALAGRAAVKKGAQALSERAAKQRLARGATVGAAAGTFGGSFALEGGGIYNEVLQETGQDRPGVAAAFGSAAAMMDVLPVMYVFKKLGFGKQATEAVTKKLLTDPSLKKDFKHVVASGLKTAAGAASLESVTEGLQTVIEKAAITYVDENKKLFSPENVDEILNATAAGALMGMTMGAGGGAIGGARQAAQARKQGSQLEFADDETGVSTPTGADTQAETSAAGRQVLEFADEDADTVPGADTVGSGESSSPGRATPESADTGTGMAPVAPAARTLERADAERPPLEFADEVTPRAGAPARAEAAFADPRRRRNVDAFMAPANTTPAGAGQAPASRAGSDVVLTDPNEQQDPHDPAAPPAGVTGTLIPHEPGAAFGTDAPSALTKGPGRTLLNPGGQPSRLEFADDAAPEAAQPALGVGDPVLGVTQPEGNTVATAAPALGNPEMRVGGVSIRRAATGAATTSQASSGSTGASHGIRATQPAASRGAQAGAASRASSATSAAPSRSRVADSPNRASKFAENGAAGSAVRSLERVAGLAKAAGEKLGIGAERPRGTPGREYTPEQRAAMERGAFGVQRKAPIAQRIKTLRERIGTRLRQGVVDQYASLQDILKDGRAWMMAHLSSSGHGALEAIMDYGRIRLEDNAIAVDTSKPSFKQVLEPLGGELDDWLMWMAGRRAATLKKVDKERLFSDVDIDALKSLADGRMADGRERRAVYEVARSQFEVINDAVLDIAVDTGLINEAERKAWKAQGVYIPFYRMLDAEDTRGPRMFSDGLARQKGVEKLKGAELPLDDLLGNVLMNWSHLLGASLRNQAAVKALESAEKMGLATSVSKDEKGKGAIYVRKDGREQWYDVESDELDGRLVLDALLSLNYEGLRGPVMKAMRAFKRALTVGVTANPSFRVANLMRDSIHSPAVVDMSTNIAKNVLNGWKGTSKQDDLYASMIAGGGAFGDSGYVHGADPELLRHLVTNRGIKRDTILDQRWRITRMWDAYQDFGARMENVNRAAAFDKARADGKDLLEANFSARDLLDFSRTGAFPVIRFLTQTVPFLNARMQGLDKMGRALADPNQRKQFAAVVGVYVMASVALYLLMMDDDDFQEAEDWERDAYHLFKLPGSDIMYRLPKPFEVGVIGTLAERLTEQVVDDKVHGRLFAERLLHAVTDTLAFNPVPQLFRPGLELWGNRDAFTDRPIESSSLRRLSPTERRRAWTSETATGASHLLDAVLWDDVVLSPVQIEHLVQGYLGWVGATTLGAIDMLVTRPLTGAPDRPSMRLEDWPGIGRFVRENPSRHNRYVGEFYENLRAIETAYADIGGMRLLGEMDQAQRMQRSVNGKLVWRDLYRKAQRMEARIQRAINTTYASRSMTAAGKRARIDSLTRRKNQIARSMVSRSRWAFE